MKKALIIANVLLASSPVFGMNANEESNNRTGRNSVPVSGINSDRESNIQSARNVRRVSDSFFNSVENGTREFNLEEYFRFRRELDNAFISALDSRIDRRSRPSTSSSSSNTSNSENIREPFPTFRNDFNRSSSRDRETPGYLINRQSHTSEFPFFSQSSSFSFDLNANSRTDRRSRPATSSSSSNPANNDNIREPLPTSRDDFDLSSFLETPGYPLWQSSPNRRSRTSETSSTSSSNDRNQTDFRTMEDFRAMMERVERELLRNSQQSKPQIKIKRDPITKKRYLVSGDCSMNIGTRMNLNTIFSGIRLHNLKLDSSMTDDQIIQALRKAVDPNVRIIME